MPRSARAAVARSEKPKALTNRRKEYHLKRAVSRLRSGPGRDADETRRMFQEALDQYPPALGYVLRLDPTQPDSLVFRDPEGHDVELMVSDTPDKPLTAKVLSTLVSATNGKTTTTRLIAEALKAAGPVVSNALGANMPAGITSALAGSSDARYGVIEVDEKYLAGVARDVSPKAIALLCHGHVEHLGRYAHVVAALTRAGFALRSMTRPEMLPLSTLIAPFGAWILVVRPPRERPMA